MTTLPPAGPSSREAVLAAVRATRAGLGFGISAYWSVADVRGADRVSFLQAQLPADLAALETGDGVFTARLDRLGRVRALVLALRADDAVWLLTESHRAAFLVADLEAYHFGEDVTLRDRGEEFAVVELHGPLVPDVLAALAGNPVALDPYRHRMLPIGGGEARFAAHPWTGDPGGQLLVPRDRCGAVIDRLRDLGGDRATALDAGAQEVLRVEGGLPRHGIEYDDRTLLHELGRDAEMVSYRKGCYLGQETVARIHARGQVHRRLTGLRLDGGVVPEGGAAVVAEGAPVGEIRSSAYSAALGRPVALAMLRRPHHEPGTILHVRGDGGRLLPAEVIEPPLYRRPGPREESRRLHEEGIALFGADRFPEALRRFERAVLLDPGNTAAHEATGVTLERMGLLEEAIAAIETLTEVDPENPMAWTNLSRYYAQQGRIEEAERAKAKSMALSWKREAGEAAARKRAAEEEAESARRAEERIALFREVLALDPEDGVANFGLGKILLDRGSFAEAAPLFEKAIAAQPDYSMAFRHLAACLVALGRRDEARGVLDRGIAAATVRGDLIPKRDMTRMLEGLATA